MECIREIITVMYHTGSHSETFPAYDYKEQSVAETYSVIVFRCSFWEAWEHKDESTNQISAFTGHSFSWLFPIPDSVLLAKHSNE